MNASVVSSTLTSFQLNIKRRKQFFIIINKKFIHRLNIKFICTTKKSQCSSILQLVPVVSSCCYNYCYCPCTATTIAASPIASTTTTIIINTIIINTTTTAAAATTTAIAICHHYMLDICLSLIYRY